MSEIKVNSIKGVAASSAAITINNTDGTATANLTNRQGKNLIINGAMNVAQRSQSSTTSASGYFACDRMRVSVFGLDEGITIEQSALTSSDTPYTKGFRYATKITNGNQTSGAGGTDTVNLMYRLEGQDINNSGWDYTSASSFVTISFWMKSSVAQTFYLRFRMTGSGSNKEFVSAISATTSWQKITKTIPGGTGVDSVNTNAEGGFLQISLFRGTDQTGTLTTDQWNTHDASAKVPDMTSTWYTTNDATFEITGLQMEVGSVATDFEHLSFADDLRKCQRYYFIYADGSGGVNQYQITNIHGYSTGQLETTIDYSCANLRAIPSLVQGSGTNYYNAVNATAAINFNSFTAIYQPSSRKGLLYTNSTSGTTPVTGTAYRCQFANNGAYIHLDAEL